MSAVPAEAGPALVEDIRATAVRGALARLRSDRWAIAGALVVYGARTSLTIGFAATAMAALIGVTVGLVAAFCGGAVDMGLSRLTDVMIAFPQLIFMIALGAIVPAGFPRELFIILVIGVFQWFSMARVVRAQTIALRHRSFVMVAEAVGAGPLHMLRREILPNLASTIVVIATITGCRSLPRDTRRSSRDPRSRG